MTGPTFHDDYKNSIIIIPLVVILVIFSVEVPILQNISKYASINSEDIAVVLVFMYFIFSKLNSDWSLQVRLPRVTFYLGLVSGWIILTLIIATLRSDQSVAASYLWVLKWFEVVAFFIVIQDIFDRVRSKLALKTMVLSGLLISIYSIISSYTGQYRIEIFFNNPNVLASFLILTMMLAAGFAVYKRSIYYFISMIVLGGAVITTGSRSGIFGLIVALTVFSLITYKSWSKTDYFALTVAGVTSVATLPFIVDPAVLYRLISWISFRGGQFVLTESSAANSFRIRAQLVEKAIELFQQQPIFGYGWFAVPSRVGYLDVYYTIILVELGIVGAILYLLFSLSIIRSWIVDYRNGAVIAGAAGAAWYCGLLAQSVGGAFPRVPQIMLLTFIVLISSRSIAAGKQ
jgi:O-antigen ligase